MNKCKHCNQEIPVGAPAMRISSWWLLCEPCYRDGRLVHIIEYEGQTLLE
jgi:hypothetical protein